MPERLVIRTGATTILLSVGFALATLTVPSFAGASSRECTITRNAVMLELRRLDSQRRLLASELSSHLSQAQQAYQTCRNALASGDKYSQDRCANDAASLAPVADRGWRQGRQIELAELA